MDTPQFEPVLNWGNDVINRLPADTFPKSLAIGELQLVARAFSRNANRIVNLAGLPVNVQRDALFTQNVNFEAERRLIRSGKENTPDKAQLHKELIEKVIEEVKSGSTTFVMGLSHNDGGFHVEGYTENYIHAVGLERIEAQYPAIAEAVQDLFYSIVVGTWTAFESLASDLWEAALNFNPKDLATLQGTKSRISKKHRESDVDKSRAQISQKDETKHIDLDRMIEIAGEAQSLKGKFGALLSYKYEFTKLRGIREAYSAAFDEKYRPQPTKIDAALAGKHLFLLNVL